MVHFYDSIPDNIIPWIQQQKIFFVASAPLSEDGHVNVSPKGFEGTFHIVDNNKVWYEDMSGSGIETISHIRENGRLTIMFVALEGPPRIIRLWGPGTVHEFDTPEYNALIPLEKRQPGSRSVIMQDVTKVSTSCGYSIPFFNFRAPRMKLHKMAAFKESKDIEAETTSCCPDHNTEGAVASGVESKALADAYLAARGYPERPATGLKGYWEAHNQKSLDGLPGLLTAFKSNTVFDKSIVEQEWANDDETIPVREPQVETMVATKPYQLGSITLDPLNILVGVLLGVFLTLVSSQARSGALKVPL